jgi:hypothetical protein
MNQLTHEERAAVSPRLAEELNWLANLTDEDKARILAEVLAASPPARPLPEGKTLADVLEGQWPGDETDEEVNEALKRLS